MNCRLAPEAAIQQLPSFLPKFYQEAWRIQARSRNDICSTFEVSLGVARHIPNSIATVRVRLINGLIKTLQRCRCCGTNSATYRRQKL
jgi:hypothetical protein